MQDMGKVAKRRGRLLWGVPLAGGLALIGVLALARLANPLLQTWSVGAHVEAVAITPAGQELAIGLLDGTIQLRQGRDGALIRAWPAGPKVLRALTLRPDGQVLAAVGPLTQVHLWRVNDGHLLTLLEGATRGDLSSGAFSPDGRLLAAGDATTIYLWQVSDGQLLHILGRGSPQSAIGVGGAAGHRDAGTTALAL